MQQDKVFQVFLDHWMIESNHQKLKKQSAKLLRQSIINLFGFDDDCSYSRMATDIQEDLETGESGWGHIYKLMDTLLPKSYHYENYGHYICPFIQNIKRTERIGLTGYLHDEERIYNIDAILSFYRFKRI